MKLDDFLKLYGITHIAYEHCQLTEESILSYVGTSEQEIKQDLQKTIKGKWKKNRYYPKHEITTFYTIEQL